MKFLISDMDGTLLNDNKEIDLDFIALIDKLKALDIKVGIASGRQYENLKKSFNRNYKDMLFICDNGAISYMNDEIIDKNPLDIEDILMIDKLINKYPSLSLIMCGIKASYLNSDDEMVINNAKMYCYNLGKYSSVEDVLKNDEIIKLAIFDKEYDIKDKYEDFIYLKNRLNITVSAKEWMDFTRLNVNKGQAFKKIKDRYNLSDRDCYVFGDYDNDITILKEAYYSFAMENATENVKKVANFRADSNQNRGVSKKIIELFNL